MVSITVPLEESFNKELEKFSWINWSDIGREAFLKKIRQLEILDKFDKDFKKSKLTDEDCITLGRELRHTMSGRD